MIAIMRTMTRRNEELKGGISAPAQPLPSWALERAMAIVREHGFALINSTNEERRIEATAGLAYAIATALAAAALSGSFPSDRE